MICPICNLDFNFSDLSELFIKHVRKEHDIKKCKTFYDLYYKIESDGNCLNCGSSTKFESLNRGYAKFCSKSCYYKDESHISKRKDTINKKYGSIDSFNDNIKRIKKEKYGCENYNNHEKQSQTMIQKYGL